jgi:GxxExxY protein
MDIIDDVIEAANEVHDELGSKHTEATYHRALERELSERGIGFSSEGTITIHYKGVPVGKRRPDMFIDGEDGTVVVELKANSNTGEEQLLDYKNILDDDSNFDISAGMLIRFNDEVEIVRP